MERIFKIIHSDKLGKNWLNKENLEACLFSSQHTSTDLPIKIEDITEQFQCEHCKTEIDSILCADCWIKYQ